MLTFAPSRDDVTVSEAIFSVYYSHPELARLHDAPMKSSWNYIDLTPVAKNQFEMAPLRVEVPKEETGNLCFSVKVWFAEIAKSEDGLFYEHPVDRYALVSYCTSVTGPDWPRAAPRFSQNRVEALAQFEEALTKPFALRLNGRALDQKTPNR